MGEGTTDQHVVEYGFPAKAIVSYASRDDIDLIVLGTHGRTGLTRLLMGSVAEHVVRNSICTVMAIKPATKELKSDVNNSNVQTTV